MKQERHRDHARADNYRQSPAVLQLLRNFNGGGAEVLTVRSAILLKERGVVQPVICGWRSGGVLIDSLTDQGVEAHVLGLPRRPLWTGPVCALDIRRIVRAIGELVAKHRIDVLHAHMADNAFLGALVKKHFGVPFVTTIHSTEPLPSTISRQSPMYRMRRYMLRWALDHCDHIIACSHSVASAVAHDLRVPEQRIDVVPNGVPIKQAGVSDRAAVRSELGIAQDDLVLVNVGRLKGHKGQGTLIEMAALLREDHPRIRLLLVGEGPDLDAFKQLAESRGVQDIVHFAGRRDDVASLLGACDMFVTASHFEGMSLALLEAMATGLPVVSSPAEGNVEVLKDGAGVIAEGIDPQAMARATTKLLTDLDLMAGLGRAARQRIEQRYSSEANIRRIESIYQRLADLSISGTPTT